MMDGGYRKRLTEDLPRWRDAGWVSAEGEVAILASLEGRRSTFGLAAIVGMLGALLIGAGILAFVAANWDYLPRIFRFGLLVSTMAAAYGAAAILAARDMRIFSEAALLVAGLVFAAAIALVGQTYHLDGEFADAVLLWEVGVIGAAILTGSAAVTVLSLIGAAYWAWLNVIDLGIVFNVASLIPVLIGAVIAIRVGALYARLAAVLTLAFWIAVNLVGLSVWLDWSPFTMLALAATLAFLFWAIGAVLATLSTRSGLAQFGHAMLWPGIAAVLLSVGILQAASSDYYDSGTGDWILFAVAAMAAVALFAILARRRGGVTLIDGIGALAIGLASIGFVAFVPDNLLMARLLGGIIVFGAALWAINQGQTGRHRVGKTTGLTAFGLEIIYIYVVTLGTRIDTALAFLMGGILFIVLAYGLFRIDRKLTRSAEAPVEVSS